MITESIAVNGIFVCAAIGSSHKQKHRTNRLRFVRCSFLQQFDDAKQGFAMLWSISYL